jgi:hypothetical protein
MTNYRSINISRKDDLMFRICATALITFLFVFPPLAYNQTEHVSAIKITGAGLFEYSEVRSRVVDDTSSVRVFKVTPTRLHISQQTNRIPIKPGLAYGVQFTVEGEPQGAIVNIEVIRRSSKPCHLPDGSAAYIIVSRERIKIGNQQLTGWVFPKPGDERTCVNEDEPAINTIEILYGGRKLAEQQFETFYE